MNKTQDKEYLFERMPVPGAVLQLSLPIVISSLVTILYNLADTFFVGMLNDPVQNAAVTLVYPVTLAFNAVNNLFGLYPIGSRMYAFLLNACHSVERSARAEFPMCASNKSFDAENLALSFSFKWRKSVQIC